MVSLIEQKLQAGVCDEVMEIAWSAMWNVTDETPRNCQRFIDRRGLSLFLQCLRAFPQKEELLRNMMGLIVSRNTVL
jgi:Zyg-11 family protein